MCSRTLSFAVTLALIILLLCAGCATIPGPDVTFTPVPTKATLPATPQVKTTTLKPTPNPTVPVAVSVARTATITPATTPHAAGEKSSWTQSCGEQGGSVVQPGQTCPTTWLVAADTLNCCAAVPVRAPPSNAPVTIAPYDLVIVMDDDPGSIVP
jgi:hypothetical protein